MQLNEKLSARFEELQDQVDGLPVASGPMGPYYDSADWRQWATSAENLIAGALGEDSTHFARFRDLYEECNGSKSKVSSLIGVYRAARADFDGGFVFRVQAQISGEIFGDFINLAKTALSGGSKDVAAVLACAALEDALKKYARLQGLVVDDQVMQSVVSALKGRGLISGAQKTLLDAMPKIRDYAMHANWDKITAQDVGSVIGFVEQFLLQHFS
jgi:hypothetical protein